MHLELFNDFSPESRVWIYQSNRVLTFDEIQAMESKGRNFTATWKAHGADLKATCKVLHGRFLIFISDESYQKAGGCSIDKLMHLVHELETEYRCTLLDRMVVTCLNGEDLITFHMREISEVIACGVLNNQSKVFNNAVATLQDMRLHWEVPVTQSFLKRYFKTQTVA